MRSGVTITRSKEPITAEIDVIFGLVAPAIRLRLSKTEWTKIELWKTYLNKAMQCKLSPNISSQLQYGTIVFCLHNYGWHYDWNKLYIPNCPSYKTFRSIRLYLVLKQIICKEHGKADKQLNEAKPKLKLRVELLFVPPTILRSLLKCWGNAQSSLERNLPNNKRTKALS